MLLQGLGAAVLGAVRLIGRVEEENCKEEGCERGGSEE
jgi:hypothetical protein